MPISAIAVILLAAASLAIAAVAAVFAFLWARSAERRADAPDSHPDASTGAKPRDVAIVGGTVVGSLLAGVGCIVLACVLVLIAWFVFVHWAFKDFTLF